MGDLSKRLSRWEFACQDHCGLSTVDIALVHALEDCADHFETIHAGRVKIHINSGHRCPTHNANSGGSVGSQHLYGKAADFYLTANGEHINDDLVADYLELNYPKQYGIGRYIGRTHLDVRTGVARWDKRA